MLYIIVRADRLRDLTQIPCSNEEGLQKYTPDLCKIKQNSLMDLNF